MDINTYIFPGIPPEIYPEALFKRSKHNYVKHEKRRAGAPTYVIGSVEEVL